VKFRSHLSISVPMPEFLPTLDFTHIRFPSDRLTIAELRKLWPSAFDQYRPPEQGQFGDIERVGSLETALGGLIDCERVYADLVFRKALGLPRADGREANPDGEASELAEDYESYGWARGWHEGREMVREIEIQVLAEAHKHLRNR
jgi:hypothetical protein